MTASTGFTLVLSGGGLKGLAHVGVFRALEERGLVPSRVVGSSMGSLIAAVWATGMSIAEMEDHARRVRRRHVFQVAHADMAFRRLMAPAIYRREPLDTLITSLVGERTFDDLDRQLLVNTADLNAGTQVLWGLPGYTDVRIADAVFASCALPGIFPPRAIRDSWYVDGAVVANLPLHAIARHDKFVIAVNVTGGSVARADVHNQGFAATYVRGLEMVMQTQIQAQVRGWHGAPLTVIEPPVNHISMFAFDRTDELIEAGYRSAMEALAALETDPSPPSRSSAA